MYGENQEEVFLGYSMGRQQNISENTSQKIDSEVRRLVELGQSEARRIITEKRSELETLAKGLLEYETLTGDEIRGLLIGIEPVRETGDDTPSNPRRSPVPAAGKPTWTKPDSDTGLAPAPQA
jgi:cell division protease FtsH